jgi:hypothetical protein
VLRLDALDECSSGVHASSLTQCSQGGDKEAWGGYGRASSDSAVATDVWQVASDIRMVTVAAESRQC